MKRCKQWLDRVVQRLCEWLDDFIPGNHGLAVLSDSIAGVGTGVLLPVDRRAPQSEYNSYIHSPEYEIGKQVTSKARGDGQARQDSDCGFWAYCYMKGQPCVWCGGQNSADVSAGLQTVDLSGAGSWISNQLCPSGKNALGAWYGCCTHPNGAMYLVAFVDCCGTGMCRDNPWNRCANWPQAKNWCVVGPTRQTSYTGPNSYFCTVAVYAGPCVDDS